VCRSVQFEEQLPRPLEQGASDHSASAEALRTAERGSAAARIRATPDTPAELPLRIEAAILLDRTLRLETLLKAQRKSAVSRVLKCIGALASALCRGAARSARAKPAGERQDVERQAKVLLKSGLFDPEYYLRRNRDVAAAGTDPVLHYLLHGAAELRSPSQYFSTRWYVRRYPDVAASGKNPLYHFIISGYAEGRLALPRNPAALAATDPLRDFGDVRPAFGQVGASSAAGIAAPARPGARLVVYTALFGNFDDLFVPTPEQAEGCDFVVFTDQPNVPPPWRRGDVSFASPSKAKQNRFYKLLPHRLFPDHEWSLYLDANIDVEMSPIEFFERHRDLGADFFAFRHPSRISIVEELAACIDRKKDDPGRMVRQVAHYLDSGFGHGFPLTENNVLLRRHNDPALSDLGEAWWQEVRSRSGRDQLSLSYVVERKGYRRIALFEEGRVSARNCPGFRIRAHRHQFQERNLLEESLA